MLRGLTTYVPDFLSAFSSARKLDLPDPKKLDHVVLTGMGGSGAGNLLTAALARHTAPFPVLVVRDYYLPKFVGPRTLVVATSYSGETEETLYAVGTAHRKGAAIAGITSGGSLATFIQREGLALHLVPAGRQPRAAIPSLFGAVLGIAHKIGLGDFEVSKPDQRRLEERVKQAGPATGRDANPARQLAHHVHKAAATIYGEGPLGAVAQRFKAQLNENAKIFARAEVLPESNHNDIVAWSEAPITSQDALVLLRARKEDRATQTRFDYLEHVASERKASTMTVRTQGESEVAQVLDALIVTDTASVYAALLRKVDPTPVNVIPGLKKRLEESGFANEARRLLGL